MLLFEILECSFDLISKNSKLLNREHLYPIAWAYLKPLGSASIHMSRSRLQLYRYKMTGTANGLVDLKTPDVFLEFAWKRKVKYPSFLEVDLQFCNRPEGIVERKHFSRAPWEKEKGLYTFIDEDTRGIEAKII